jgi:hypothetical protein
MESRSAKEFLGSARRALLWCTLIGCGYKPGSFAYPDTAFAGQRATVGCLDVAVERRADVPIEVHTGAVLRFQFANRCDHPQAIDLGAVAVIGRSVAGGDERIAPYDPRAELHAVALDGRSMGAESLAYPADHTMEQVCVDVATLVPQEPPRWLCFAGTAGTVVGSVAVGAP